MTKKLSEENLNFNQPTGSAFEKHTKLNQCCFTAAPASQLNGGHDARERYDGTYGTHRLHATKYENKLLSCYLVLVNKVSLVLHSPDMKLHKKRLHSYFRIVNSM